MQPQANDEGFTPYAGEGNPLRGTQGALVRLRSGELALIAPQDSDEYDLDTEIVWNHVGDDDDIVAYKPIAMSSAERLARAAASYLHLQEAYSKPPFGDVGVSNSFTSSAKRELVSAIAAYKEAWPDFPEYASLRRLRDWNSEE